MEAQESIPSRGPRCARPVRVWCESFKCSFSSLFLISVRGGPTPAAAWNMTPESGALFGGSLRSSNHKLRGKATHCLDDFEQSNNTAMLVPDTKEHGVLAMMNEYLLTSHLVVRKEGRLTYLLPAPATRATHTLLDPTLRRDGKSHTHAHTRE